MKVWLILNEILEGEKRRPRFFNLAPSLSSLGISFTISQHRFTSLIITNPVDIGPEARFHGRALSQRSLANMDPSKGHVLRK